MPYASYFAVHISVPLFITTQVIDSVNNIIVNTVKDNCCSSEMHVQIKLLLQIMTSLSQRSADKAGVCDQA